MRHLFVLAMTLIIGACSMQFQLSQQQLNERLSKAVNQSHQFSLPKWLGIDASLEHKDVELNEAAQTLTLITQLNLNLTLGEQLQQAQIINEITASPYYDDVLGAVFLRNVEVKQRDIQPSVLREPLSYLNPIVNMAINSYIKDNAIYTLNTDEHKQALAKRFGKALSIKSNALVFELGQ